MYTVVGYHDRGWMDKMGNSMCFIQNKGITQHVLESTRGARVLESVLCSQIEIVDNVKIIYIMFLAKKQGKLSRTCLSLDIN